MPRKVRRESSELVVSRSVVSGTWAGAALVVVFPTTVVFACAGLADDDDTFLSSSS